MLEPDLARAAWCMDYSTFSRNFLGPHHVHITRRRLAATIAAAHNSPVAFLLS